MNMKNKLMDCPFCGGEAHVCADIFRKSYEAICDHCGSRTAPCVYGRGKLPVGGHRLKNDQDARAEAVRLWNSRAGV